MNVLDRLAELNAEARDPGGIYRAIAYQDYLHVLGAALIEVARAAEAADPRRHVLTDSELGARRRKLRRALAPLLIEDESP